MKKRSAFLFSLITFISSLAFFAVPAKAVVDCAENSLSNLSVFVPPTINREDPSGINFVFLPAEYQNQFVDLFFTPVGQTDVLAATYSVAIPIDGSGNANLESQTLNQLIPSLPEGSFTVEVRGGPIPVQNSDGSSGDRHPVCLRLSFPVSVEGGANCKKLGDECVPNQPLFACESASFCDATQNPPTVRLPTLKREILQNAECQYLATPGDASCGEASANLAYVCEPEIMTPVEETLCCRTEGECGRSKGEQNNSQNEGFSLCKQAGPNFKQCVDCFEGQGDYSQAGIWSGLGCIPYKNPAMTIRAFIILGLGFAGMALVLMTLAGAFLITTSRGEQQRIDEGKSLITSAVSGILFIIFSVSILTFIGVTILHIPGLG